MTSANWMHEAGHPKLVLWDNPEGWGGEAGMATHYSILAWKIPWTEEPGGLPSTRSQRVRHD